MANEKPVGLKRLTSGVPGLDEVLGGGIPEYSFNIVAGEPGSGKTTLVHQLLFANATVERPALYFTALGEPPLKMLRYQQQLGFFDISKVGSAIRFVDLGAQVKAGDLDGLLAAIIAAVDEASPALVVVDSFRSVIPTESERGGGIKSFLQQLAMHLTSWQATTFLLGDYSEDDVQANPVFTVCDGLIWMFQTRDRSSVIRRLQVKKMRGAAPMPGIHTFRMSDEGVRVFPRTQRRPVHDRRAYSNVRLSTGIPTLDEMMDGGLPCGDAMLVAGPTGVGKTLVGTHFIADGLQRGEAGVVAVFEEHPDDYLNRAKELGFDLDSAVASGKLKLVYLRPLDLSVDETLLHLREAIESIDARRFVIDSLTGLELALAPNFREDDFRDALYRMVGALTGERVTTVMVVEVTEHFHELSFSPHAISFLTENIVLLRYAEMDGLLEKVVAVVKMRRSAHSRELRRYTITDRGLLIDGSLRDYQGVLTGAAKPRNDILRLETAELTNEDARILGAMTKLGPVGVEAIAGELGMPVVDLAPALRRLVVLAYVLASVEGDVVTYRPVGRAPST